MALDHHVAAAAIGWSSQKRLLLFLLYFLTVLIFVWANDYIGMSLIGLVEGVPNMARILGEMIPPDISRIRPIGNALLETILIALVGTVYGVIFGFFLAIFATRYLSPHRVFYYISRGLIALFRTVPDLIWAVFFVVAVGLGPFAGALTKARKRRYALLEPTASVSSSPPLCLWQCLLSSTRPFSVWRKQFARQWSLGWLAPAVSASS